MSAINQLYQDYKLRQNSWRQNLIGQMSSLEASGVDCRQCPGHCCTQKRNSMQITLAEGIALYFDLSEKNLITHDLRNKLKQSVVDARLDQFLYIKGKALRRNYTCPLFELKGFGCPLSRHSKPFGCLGYNATSPNEIEGNSCRSEVELLESTEQLFHAEINDFSLAISAILNIPTEKLSIPQMILLLDKHLASL